jgi:AcrR family transcriptional regulator
MSEGGPSLGSYGCSSRFKLISDLEVQMAPPDRENGNGSPDERASLAPGGAGAAERDQLDARWQRERLLEAMAACCAENGYRGTSVADVTTRAGLPEAVFSQHFRDLEECVDAAVELIMTDTLAVLGRAYSDDKAWFAMVRDGLAAMLKLWAEKPDFARLAFLEARVTSPGAYERYRAADSMIAALLERGRDDPAYPGPLPRSTARGVMGGAEALIARELVAGRAAELPRLLPDLVYVALLPYMGQAQALRHSRLAAEGER